MILQNPGRELPDVYLFSKKILAKGGDRKVRICWNLLTGEPYVRKPIMSPKKTSYEAKVLTLIKLTNVTYHQWKNVNQGTSLPTRTCPTIENPDIYRASMIERLYEGSLDSFFGSTAFTSITKRISILTSLLNAIACFQRFTSRESLSDGTIIEANVTHGDISLKNFLLSLPNPYTHRYALIDFAQTGNLLNRTHTPGCLAPEYVAFFEQDYTRDELVIFNQQHLEGKDVWAAGIIGAMLLSGSWATERTDIRLPPMNHTEAARRALLSKGELSELRKYNPIATLSQYEINLNLVAMKNLAQSTDTRERDLINAAWEAVNQMLQIDPKQRIQADDAVELLTAAKEAYERD